MKMWAKSWVAKEKLEGLLLITPRVCESKIEFAGFFLAGPLFSCSFSNGFAAITVEAPTIFANCAPVVRFLGNVNYIYVDVARYRVKYSFLCVPIYI